MECQQRLSVTHKSYPSGTRLRGLTLGRLLLLIFGMLIKIQRSHAEKVKRHKSPVLLVKQQVFQPRYPPPNQTPIHHPTYHPVSAPLPNQQPDQDASVPRKATSTQWLSLKRLTEFARRLTKAASSPIRSALRGAQVRNTIRTIRIRSKSAINSLLALRQKNISSWPYPTLPRNSSAQSYTNYENREL